MKTLSKDSIIKYSLILSLIVFLLLTITFVKLDQSLTTKLIPRWVSPYHFVRAHFGRYGSTYLLLNTGQEETGLYHWFVKANAIPTKKIRRINSLPHLPLQTQLLFMQLGNSNSGAHLFKIYPSTSEFEGKGVGGQLNPHTFFVGKDILLDFPNNRLDSGALARDETAQRNPVDQLTLNKCRASNRALYTIEILVNSFPGRFFIDTGSSFSSINSSFAKKIRTGTFKPASFAPGNNILSIFVRIGHSSHEIRANIKEQNSQCPHADGTLGITFLAKQAWLINSKRTLVTIY